MKLIYTTKNFCNYLLLILCCMASITLYGEDISELVLPNGLKIIVKPDHRSSSAVFQIWYKVGSAYEHEGSSGISHLLEHLMFLTNNNIPLGRRFNHLSDIGAIGNAYTGKDYTFYYHIMDKKHLASAFELEAGRMQHLSPSQTEFNIEKKVILEELHARIGKDPYLPAYNALYEQAFKNHGYQFPVIGRLEDQQKLTLPKAMLWYKNYYSADNASIVVVGDIKAEEVFALARKYFSPVKKVKLITQQHHDRQEKQSTRIRFVMPQRIKVGAILMAFKVPSIKTSVPAWEAYALEVLAGWFESGNNSRLSKTLIRDQQLANEITITYSSISRDDTLFIIEAIPAQGVSLKQLEKALIKKIKQTKNELINPQSLQKIKNQMIATEIFDRDSMYTQAKIIGQAESVGIHWADDAQYISHIESVTAEQVQKVLNKYLIPANETIVIQNSHKTENRVN